MKIEMHSPVFYTVFSRPSTIGRINTFAVNYDSESDSWVVQDGAVVEVFTTLHGALDFCFQVWG